MAKMSKPWFHFTVTCNLDTCTDLLTTLAESERNTYGKINLYDCEEPADVASTDNPGAAAVRPFGAPD